MRSEFRDFLLTSNALALAIGVVFGAALGTVVNSLVKDILMPPIGYALGGVDFASIRTVLAPAQGIPGTEGYVPEVAILWGVFIQNCIAFVVIALVVFLITKWIVRPAPEPATKDCPFCKEAILADATRCRYCGSQL